MSITDELREWAEGDTLRAGMSLRTAHDQALAIADRLDAEHEREVTMACGEAVAKLGNNVAREYVKLPKDADGVPIRVGDVMDGYNDTTVAKGLTLSANGWDMVCNNGLWHDPEAFTHHHEPDTWERIIEDAIKAGFADGDPHDPDQMEASELVARCKALAGEDA